jgi:hypothetical protein
MLDKSYLMEEAGEKIRKYNISEEGFFIGRHGARNQSECELSQGMSGVKKYLRRCLEEYFG